MSVPAGNDLIVLSADLDTEFTLKGLFPRVAALNTRPFTPHFNRHVQRDPGCRTDSHNFLRAQANRFHFALVVFDLEGCGKEHQLTREEMETEVEARLSANGWDDRAAAVVIDPEIENWVWSSSPKVAEILGWGNRSPALNQWLVDHNFSTLGQVKPKPPKAAFREVTRLTGVGHSASIFKELAEHVSFRNCQDAAFQKLLTVLRNWFPVQIS